MTEQELTPIGGAEQTEPRIIDDGGVKVVEGFDESKHNFDEVVAKAKGEDFVPEGQEASEYKYNPLWDIAKSNFTNSGVDFELPEALKTGKIGDKPLTPEDEWNLLQETIVENTRFGFEDDPLISYFMFAKERNPDLDQTQLLKEYEVSMNVHQMEEDTFLREYLKANQPEMEEQQINETINKLGAKKSEITEQLKREVLSDFYNTHDEIAKKKNAEYEAYMQKFDKQREADVTNLLSKVKSEKKVGELTFDDETLSELENDFKGTFLRSESNKLVSINVPEKFLELIGDDNSLMKLYAYAKYGDKVINKEIEKRKQELEEQLGITPKLTGSSQRSGGLINPI